MIERLGIIVTVAFVLTRVSFFRRLLDQQAVIDRRQQLWLVIIFGCFGIIGTYMGLVINPIENSIERWTRVLGEDEAIANSRVLGIVVAGLLGGWKIGVSAGIIAGVHRIFLGGFTGIACGVATIIAGVIAGIVAKRQQKDGMVTPQVAFIVGGAAEAVQMLVILAVAKPFDKAMALVQDIGLSMIAANALGTALFILIIRSVVQEEEKMGAVQSQKALRIANSTLIHMRKGLTGVSASAVCAILYKEIPSLAVSITDRDHILSHIGKGEDHHRPAHDIRTEATRKVIENGQGMTVGKKAIQCNEKNCPLHAAVIVPLKQQEVTVGTLKVYFQSVRDISPIMMELIQGLSTLLSQQLEIAEGEKHRALAKELEIKALQAQVSPHFLFNAMNTIVSLIRTNPAHARKLLIALSSFFRQNLAGSTKSFSTLKEEVDHVKSYLSIEEARFQDRLNVLYDLDEEALSATVPSMTLQPLVENSIKHGLKSKLGDGVLQLSIQQKDSFVQVMVQDNGAGIPKERLQQLMTQQVESESGTGIGLYNVNERLKKMLSENAALNIRSSAGEGTSITFKITKNQPNIIEGAG
ncbi:sensor histidine kinase [Jeotgalibacillus soli]|nr:sensor histidine kinase [Jeotgalibacillus soli]